MEGKGVSLEESQGFFPPHPLPPLKAPCLFCLCFPTGQIRGLSFSAERTAAIVPSFPVHHPALG